MRKWLLAGLGALVLMTGLQAEELAIGKGVNPLTCLHRKRCCHRKRHSNPCCNPIPGPMGFPGVPGATGPTGPAGATGTLASVLLSSFTDGTQPLLVLPATNVVIFGADNFPPIGGVTRSLDGTTFQVPVSGIYHITWTGTVNNTITADPIQRISVRLFVNGIPASPDEFQSLTTTLLGFATFSGQTSLALTAGSTLQLILEDDSILEVGTGATLSQPTFTISLLAPTP